ncbi:MAG: hypothetical protein AVDCRST_MAG89-2035, partial [uncultured Gemmatimonadetes bacterium]
VVRPQAHRHPRIAVLPLRLRPPAAVGDGAARPSRRRRARAQRRSVARPARGPAARDGAADPGWAAVGAARAAAPDRPPWRPRAVRGARRGGRRRAASVRGAGGCAPRSRRLPVARATGAADRGPDGVRGALRLCRGSGDRARPAGPGAHRPGPARAADAGRRRHQVEPRGHPAALRAGGVLHGAAAGDLPRRGDRRRGRDAVGMAVDPRLARPQAVPPGRVPPPRRGIPSRRAAARGRGRP